MSIPVLDRKRSPSLVTRAKRALWHTWVTGDLPPRSPRFDYFPTQHPILAAAMVAVVGLVFIAVVDLVLFLWWTEVAP